MTSNLGLALSVLLLLFHASLALKVNTEITEQGPKVCVWSENIVPENVASMCQHRGLWYIGGQFNRFGDQVRLTLVKAYFLLFQRYLQISAF